MIPEPALFTPAETERITGLSVNMQRDWRKRGFLNSAPGHARFDAFEVADIAVMQALAKAGIGPSTGSRSWKRGVGLAIVSRALMEHRAWDWRSPDMPNLDAERLRILAARHPTMRYDGTLPANWKEMVEKPGRFAVWWDGEAAAMGDDLTGILLRKAEAGRPVKPAVVLDLEVMARDLLERANEPLFTLLTSPKTALERVLGA